MKINNHKNKKTKKILVIIIVVLLLGSISLLLLHYFKPHQQNASTTTTNPTRSTSDKQQAANIMSNPTNKETSVNTDTPAPSQVNNQTGKTVAQMIVSTDVSSSTVYIRGGINNLAVNNGTCSAELTGPSGQTITQTTDLLRNASTTDCKTVSIPTSNLTSGQWKVHLHYISNEAEGKSDDVSFTIR